VETAELEGLEVSAWPHAAPLCARPRLTDREETVLELIAQGGSTAQIACRLCVSNQTVTYHLGNLLAKFGASNRAGLVARAFVYGFLTADSWPPRAVTPCV
jgi:DNA-binding CsgD family transcriptional regulator